MIGDIVGRAREAVEAQDGRAVLPPDEPGRDRKILAPMGLGLLDIGEGCHPISEVLP